MKYPALAETLEQEGVPETAVPVLETPGPEAKDGTFNLITTAFNENDIGLELIVMSSATGRPCRASRTRSTLHTGYYSDV